MASPSASISESISESISAAVVSGLCLNYGLVRALDGVDLVLAPASITGLVGPNGAGKTSLMRALVGLQSFDTGQILVQGVDLQESPRIAQGMVAYVSDQFGIFPELTVRQALEYQARCHHVSSSLMADHIDWAAATMGLEALMARPGGQLSRGQRQRLAIAMAIVYHPSLLVLDEPASGLDPDARAHLSETFRTLAAQGMTLLVSSHILAELADYATDIAMMDKGRLVEKTALRGIARPLGRCRIVLAAPCPAMMPDIAGLTVLDRPAPDILVIEDLPDRAGRADLLMRMIQQGLAISECTPETNTTSGSLIDLYRRRVTGAVDGGTKNIGDHDA